MIDVHTHILPGIDDGAKDKEEALGILRSLKEQGVKKVVLTPHYYGKKHSPQQFIERREAAFAEIREELPEGIECYLGAEVHFTPELFVSDGELSALTIQNTRYLLTELPFETNWNEALFHRLHRFIRNTECFPVLAHVERYEEVRRDPNILERFIGCGCLVQVTGEAFLEKHTRSLAFALLQHGYVHFLGSDAHNLTDRPPIVEAVAGELRSSGGTDALKWIDENAERMLGNYRIRKTQRSKIRRCFGKYY